MNKQYIKASSDDIDFSDKQIILSTYEMDKENYILYKFYKYNKIGQSFNVKEEIYG